MIQVHFTQQVEDEFRRAFGATLDREVLGAVVAEGFRSARLSIGQAARLLDMTIDEANGLMLRRGVRQEEPTLGEIELEATALENRLSRGDAP